MILDYKRSPKKVIFWLKPNVVLVLVARRSCHQMPKGQPTPPPLVTGGGAITSFFSRLPPPPPGPGRPPRSSETRGRPPAQQTSGTTPRPAQAVAQAVPTVEPQPEPGQPPDATSNFVNEGSASKARSKRAPSPSVPRVDWSAGANLEKMRKAVDDWLGKKGVAAEEGMGLKHYAARMDVSFETFRKYVCKDVGKRRVLGAVSGKQRLLSKDIESFTVDVLRRRDRANDGLNRLEALDLMSSVSSSLSLAQIRRCFDRNIRPANKHLLTGIIKAQASTEKRNAITVPQQFRWHSNVDAAYQMLRDRNLEVGIDCKTFGELMAHFILGGDETCLLASNGDVTVIGDKLKAKHEKATAGSRVSITVYRCGSAAGADGPTAMLPPGVYLKKAYSDGYLTRHGAVKGSTVVMTANGFMTEAAWIEMAPSIAAGIRAMPVICDHPDWWVVKIIDGFGAHTSSLKAMEIYNDHKIILLKEEGDTSQVCQAYDQEVAKADKRSMRDSLAFLRRTTSITKGVIDGWQLIPVALAACRELEPDTWVHSFKKVNLHPHFRVDFPTWCARISHFLHGGESFKPQMLTDEYALLPSWWHGMLPEEKSRAYAVFEKHECSFSVECVKELTGEKGFVLLADMQNLRVCLELATSDRTHLSRGLPDAPVADTRPETVAVQAQVDVSDGLETFQLHPKAPDGTQKYTGQAKFDHLLKFARRSVKRDTPLTPSAYLDVEFTAAQTKLLKPSAEDYTMAEIISTTHGAGAAKHMAKRKLNALGDIGGESGFANDEGKMKRLKNQLRLAVSVAEINRVTDNDKAADKSKKASALTAAAPAAVSKLRGLKADVEITARLLGLTIAEMSAVAWTHFNATTLSGNKAAHAKTLGELITKQPTVLNIPVAAVAPAAQVTPAGPVAATPATVNIPIATAMPITPDVPLAAPME